MATRENIGLFVLGALLAILAAGAVLIPDTTQRPFRYHLSPRQPVEVERCLDGCGANGSRCNCDGEIG